MSWIKIEDQEPELGVPVLGYMPGMVGRKVRECVYKINTPMSRQKFFTCPGWGSVKVTHWQPIPDGPNKEEK